MGEAFADSFMDLGDDEPHEARLVDYIDRLESIDAMLGRLERGEPATGDLNIFYKKFPCAPHTRVMPNGGGVHVNALLKAGFACVVAAKDDADALPANARYSKWMDAGKSDFWLKQGNFRPHREGSRLQKAHCDIKLSEGATAQIPRLAVKKYCLRLPDGTLGKWAIYRVVEHKDSAPSVKGAAAGSSIGGGGGAKAGSGASSAGASSDGSSASTAKAGRKRGRKAAEVEEELEDIARAGCADDKTREAISRMFAYRSAHAEVRSHQRVPQRAII